MWVLGDDCETGMEEFFLQCDDCDLAYINIRDLAEGVEYKKYVELLWARYKPYADRHFREDARSHFQERFWEMYLGNTFLDKNFQLNSDIDKGPEFHMNIEGRKCWIEAIAPGSGEGHDAVPEMEDGKSVATRVPTDEIILRLRHAIYEKHKKYLNSLSEGIIKNDDSYVLAINSKRIRTIVGDADLPLIAKAVYPFGSLAAVFDITINEIVDTHHEYRDKIEKRSGSNVSTDIFLTKEYSGISAVIYSDVDAANKPKKFGSDFRLVHNKMATNPIPLGTFKFGVEYWLENDELKNNNWN